MVSAVQFGFLKAMIENQNDLEACIDHLRGDIGDLQFDKIQLLSLLEQFSRLTDKLTAENSHLAERNAYLENYSDDLYKRYDSLRASHKKLVDNERTLAGTVQELRQQVNAADAELREQRDFSLNLGRGFLIHKADANGKQAMIDLLRNAPQGIDLDAPSDDVMAPEGHRDSPLQSAYRVEFTRYLISRSFDRKTVESHEAKNGKLPFPVADYIEWLSDPGTQYVQYPRKRKSRGFVNTDATLMSGGATGHSEEDLTDDEVVVPSGP